MLDDKAVVQALKDSKMLRSRYAVPRSDGLNDQIIEWSPQWASMYREHSSKWNEGIIAWDGLLLDGWAPIVHGRSCGH